MSTSVREVIVEAATRVNLAPQRNPYPGVVENAFRLLKGIISKYNNDNLLVWTQNSVIVPKSNLIHIYDESDYLKGEHNLYFDNERELNSYKLSEEDYENNTWAIVKEAPNVVYSVIRITTPAVQFQWLPHVVNEPYSQRYQEMKRYESMTHVQVRDVAKINSIYVINNTNEQYREHYKLDFVNHTDYDKFSNTSRVYTYTPKSEGEWLIEVKPYIYSGAHRLKINYNEAFNIDLNTDLYIPDNYVELLIVALAHKLALMYPRLDEAQMNRLQQEVQVLCDNIRTPRSEDRLLLRSDYFCNDRYTMSQQDLMSSI